MKISSNIYNLTYGLIVHQPKVNCEALIEGKNLIGHKIISTSPYLTSSDFSNCPIREWKEYLDFCIKLYKKIEPDYLLIKTDNYALLGAIDQHNFFIDDTSFVKTCLNISGTKEDLWGRLSKKVRAQVNKTKLLLPVHKLGKLELLDDFYRVTLRTQTDLGTPVHSIEYFRNIITFESTAHLLVLYVDEVPVSSALVVVQKNVIYHPYAGTIADYKTTYINNLLYWRIIEFGINNKCTVFDMGRSQKGSGNAKYKKRWGAEELPLYYVYITDNISNIPCYTSTLAKMFVAFWKHVPLFFARKYGWLLIRTIF